MATRRSRNGGKLYSGIQPLNDLWPVSHGNAKTGGEYSGYRTGDQAIHGTKPTQVQEISKNAKFGHFYYISKAALKMEGHAENRQAWYSLTNQAAKVKTGLVLPIMYCHA